MKRREAFGIGIELLLGLQQELGRPINRTKRHVDWIVKNSDLEGDPRERYFRLLATCALMGKESMYWNFKRRRKHGNTIKK